MTHIDPQIPGNTPPPSPKVGALTIGFIVLSTLIGVGSVVYFAPDSPWARATTSTAPTSSGQSTRTVPIERMNPPATPVSPATPADPANR